MTSMVPSGAGARNTWPNNDHERQRERQLWRRYEQAKRHIARNTADPAEYHRQIRALADRLGV